jgi:hypothetical protein
MDELFVDPNQVIREAIVSALKPYARLAATGWGFYPDPNFDELDAQQRMLVVLIGRKASRIAEKVEDDRIDKDELCSLAGIGEGTYAPYAPRMERAGLIRREGNSLWVPDEAIVRACNVILGRAPTVGENGSRSSGARRKANTAPNDAEDESGSGGEDGAGAEPEGDETADSTKRSRRTVAKSAGPRRARSAKDFMVLYSGRADLSSFPHPDDLGDSVRVALLPLLVARDGYKLEGLPLKEISNFLREKYGREIPEKEIEAALSSVRARYVDTRFDTHMNQTIYCLLEQGRSFLADRRTQDRPTEVHSVGTMAGE